MTDTTARPSADARADANADTDTDVATLVRRLADRAAIVDLGIAHAAAIDERDWNRLRSCYTADASADFEGIGPLATYADIERACRTAIEPLSASQHLVTNADVAIDPDGNTADVRSSFHAQHVQAGTPGGDQFVVAGTYRDRVVRTPDGWRISRRDLTVLWTTGNPEVLQT